jgi:hypothetical protein
VKGAAIQWSDGAAGPLLAALGDLASGTYSWMDEAVCAEVDNAMFFPGKGGSAKDPKRICGWCDVREQCLAYALDLESRPGTMGRFGVYGGTSPKERDRIAAERGRQAA